MAGMDEEYILNAIYMLRNENPENYEKIINILIDQYDEFSQSYEGDPDSAESEELKRILKESELDKLDSFLLNMVNMDRKPAAKIDPSKETPYFSCLKDNCSIHLSCTSQYMTRSYMTGRYMT